ncbi:Brd8 protein [Capsaspora owczarzaki ATCC 30864]|uniref:Brd8 protein n=1 Tax=Capsaspora owczarzaki (strain ATCC 30864) TaxID=595528 RepID=A0A0D2VKM9_CAPO3|nr:Brd8 protein [Capsaspora owczarzaki ATCC 30864]KJE90587.1 Brd8 protein [Capsaspora owczarzaki ATCC 30864]|eukprot:XP_004364751.1 Brd8 protein [Capsaspora owczarzaki ATCC 30864]
MATTTSTAAPFEYNTAAKWTVREQLILAQAVLAHGENNWDAVCQALLCFADVPYSTTLNNVTNVRSAEWFTPKRCQAQYAELVEAHGTPKRKRGDASAVAELPAITIEKRLFADRQDELRKSITHDSNNCRKLRLDMQRIEAGELDAQLPHIIAELSGNRAAAVAAAAAATAVAMDTSGTNGLAGTTTAAAVAGTAMGAATPAATSAAVPLTAAAAAAPIPPPATDVTDMDIQTGLAALVRNKPPAASVSSSLSANSPMDLDSTLPSVAPSGTVTPLRAAASPSTVATPTPSSSSRPTRGSVRTRKSTPSLSLDVAVGSAGGTLHTPSSPNPVASSSDSMHVDTETRSRLDLQNPPPPTNAAWKKSIMIVWRNISNHRYANVFLRPVTDDEVPGYSSVIKRPMDLTTIRKRIDDGTIRSTRDFLRDIYLMFANALMYNDADHDVYLMAVEMRNDAREQILDFMETEASQQDDGSGGGHAASTTAAAASSGASAGTPSGGRRGRSATTSSPSS